MNIRAKIMNSWKHFNCKFYPNDQARVKDVLPDYLSNRQKKYIGKKGIVKWATTVDGKLMRSWKREYTKYYLKFADNEVVGFNSWDLDNV